MTSQLIQEKLDMYLPQSIEEETDALKEIMQEIILYGLSLSNFFSNALFQGGTALRILYGLPRFSEDLDFMLIEPDPQFNWAAYIDGIKSICEEYGIVPDILDKSNANSSIQKLFLKDNSIGKILNLNFKHHYQQKIMIKLEIDINPPLGSLQETKYLDFPLNYAVSAQDLASNFSGKSHALLCRKYLKGRDWYDFLWYVSKRITPNLTLFENAINQSGPWENQHISVTPQWFIEALENKIKSVNWDQAKMDVERFLRPRDRQQLSLWNTAFFLDRAQKLKSLF